MTGSIQNPFEYEAANNLSDELVADYFIDDFNYSRFIKSRRNIFVVGERGSGKTMALLYSSFRIQRLIHDRQGRPQNTEYIGIYVPCNTPLTYKAEFELLDDFLARILSEHLLVLSIAHATVTTLDSIPNVADGVDQDQMREELSAVLGADLSRSMGIFGAIRVFLEQQIRETQRAAASRDLGAYHQDTFSFSSLVLPLLATCRRSVPALRDSHFCLLIDDAHSLNLLQVRALNSWIAFRDHSLFSFKVATTKVPRMSRRTDTGGAILEGHDYTTVNLELSLHNRNSPFYQLAEKIIARRLADAGIAATPKEFFPVNRRMEAGLRVAAEETHTIAVKKYGPNAIKAIRDFVYKYHRARYFQARSSQANRPPYSGFETLVFISTGVVRNLLEPCYRMFDREVSEKGVQKPSDVAFITPPVQSEVIMDRSDSAWERLYDGLANSIEGCSREDGRRAHKLMDALGSHFRDRLLTPNASEPSALSFTVSRGNDPSMEQLEHIFDILRSAHMLYVRMGPAKDGGRREPYYVPNRILWPSRGLDPHGQHARVSIPSNVLWAATDTGRIDTGPVGVGEVNQLDLREERT